MSAAGEHTTRLVEHLFREQSGKMSAILTRIFGFRNSELIDDIIQETFLAALKTWGMKGSPENPEAWLMLVAKNKIINELNRRKLHSAKREQLHYAEAQEKIDGLFLDHEIKDSQLRILFACCHPDLNPKVQIMLTLKVLSGFGDREIASALLMKPSAVKKSIYRARGQLQRTYDHIGIPFIKDVKDRFDTVLTIIYLIFNEGYKTSVGESVYDEDLCHEAVRLSFLMLKLPDIDKGKVYALLSLIYFSLARFPSRVNETGELVDIESQDRQKWNKQMIDVGVQLQIKSRSSKELSKYHLESTIAGVHCLAKSFKETDWNTIEFCYEKLLALSPSFVVRLNHAIAVSNTRGNEYALKLLHKMENNKISSQRFLLYAAIGQQNLKLCNYETARSYYQVALDQCEVSTYRAFISKKIMECERLSLQAN